MLDKWLCFLSNKDKLYQLSGHWGVKLCHAYLMRSRGVLRGFVVKSHHAP